MLEAGRQLAAHLPVKSDNLVFALGKKSPLDRDGCKNIGELPHLPRKAPSIAPNGISSHFRHLH